MEHRSRCRRLIAAVTIAGCLAAAAPAAAVDEAAVAVPAPSRQPVFAPSQGSGILVGHLSIPVLGVDEPIRSGVAASVIDRGVAHWAGTAIPGRPGNVVLAGHRTTHTAPFRDLDRLRPGDLVDITWGSGSAAMYRVTDTLIVGPDDVWITYDVPGRSMLTMFACHPRGSSRLRIVVRAELVGGGRIA